jgi:hypothetical protein
LCVDPRAQGAPILLNLPRQKRLVAQGQRPRIGNLLWRRGQGVSGSP